MSNGLAEFLFERAAETVDRGSDQSELKLAYLREEFEDLEKEFEAWQQRRLPRVRINEN